MPLPFLLKKIVTALILPPTGLILLALIGLWLIKKYPKAGKAISTLSLVALLILSLPVTGNALLKSLEAHPPVSKSQLTEAQAIVILGGGKYNRAPEYGNQDTVKRWTLERLRYGALLQHKSALPILVSGGAPFGGRSEAEAMRETLQESLGSGTVWIENQSRDTAENAIYSANDLKKRGIHRIILVTHAWHMHRAAELFRSTGLDVLPAPTGFTTSEDDSFSQWLPQSSALDKSSIAIKEYLGQLMSN